MKVLALIAVAALVTTPALAAKAKHKHQRDHGAYQRVVPGDWRHSQNRYDPYAVYSYDGRLIGRDPDPNIRQSLRDEDWYFRYRN